MGRSSSATISPLKSGWSKPISSMVRSSCRPLLFVSLGRATRAWRSGTCGASPGSEDARHTGAANEEGPAPVAPTCACQCTPSPGAGRVRAGAARRARNGADHRRLTRRYGRRSAPPRGRRRWHAPSPFTQELPGVARAARRRLPARIAQDQLAIDVLRSASRRSPRAGTRCALSSSRPACPSPPRPRKPAQPTALSRWPGATKRPTDPAVCLFTRQTTAKCGKTRTPPDTPRAAKYPCKSARLRSHFARLKIVVSPVRVGVSPSAKALPVGAFVVCPPSANPADPQPRSSSSGCRISSRRALGRGGCSPTCSTTTGSWTRGLQSVRSRGTARHNRAAGWWPAGRAPRQPDAERAGDSSPARWQDQSLLAGVGLRSGRTIRSPLQAVSGKFTRVVPSVPGSLTRNARVFSQVCWLPTGMCDQ